jgi:hypothetical protein
MAMQATGTVGGSFVCAKDEVSVLPLTVDKRLLALHALCLLSHLTVPCMDVFLAAHKCASPATDLYHSKS